MAKHFVLVSECCGTRVRRSTKAGKFSCMNCLNSCADNTLRQVLPGDEKPVTMHYQDPELANYRYGKKEEK